MPVPIFIIDSSPTVRRMVEQISSPRGYEVLGFQDGPTALEAARRMTPALIIADYHLADMTFSGFCKELTKLDHLSETILMSLVGPSDRVDEQHLHGLGVRALLKKPLQNDDLVKAISELKSGSLPTSGPQPTLKKRAWPPDSMATDLDIGPEASTETELDSSPDCGLPFKEERPMTAPICTPSTSAPAGRMANHASTASTTAGESAIRGLLDYLLHVIGHQAQQNISELVSVVVAKDLPIRVSQAVRDEVERQIAVALSADRIEATVRETVMNELSKQTASQAAAMENGVRRHVEAIAPPIIERTSDKLIQQLVDAGLQKHVPPAVRDHLGPVEQVVKNEVGEAMPRYARQTIEEIIRETARDRIQEAVERLVPDMAETQIKEEINRLTAAE